MRIDFHTHAFPDYIANKAIPTLEKAGKVTANTAGTIDSLMVSMDQALIEKSVICSIATHPSQFESIFSWSKEIRNNRIIPFPSVHPADKKMFDRLKRIRDDGFWGIKMHPYYQDFELDEQRLFPLYEALSEMGLILITHCGYDIAYPKSRIADPKKTLTIQTAFPDLKLIATHLGGWNIWDEVESILIGKEIYLEISFALNYLPKEQAKRMLENHPGDHILFGSDSPWDDQKLSIERLKSLGLEGKLEEAILCKNAQALLNLQS